MRTRMTKLLAPLAPLTTYQLISGGVSSAPAAGPLPDNALFSDAKDSGMSAADLEIAKPQEADFDLGASDEDDTICIRCN